MTNVDTLKIGQHSIGPDSPCFIIAEVGVNHNGDVNIALQLIDKAAEAGVDAVKFQTYHTERLVSQQASKAQYQISTTGAEQTQFEMLKQLELDQAAHDLLAARCSQRGVLFLSTPFDEVCADLLYEKGVPAFKISSGDLTNLPLLEHVSRKGLPMILSTGMSNLDEVRAAADAILNAGNSQLVLLHCVSNYPAAAYETNLRAMATMRESLGLPVGFSDHSLGTEIPVAAVALGACVIEKHLTYDIEAAGPDHHASLEPPEMAQMVRLIRNVEQALGDGRKWPCDSELAIAAVGRKSLHWKCALPVGTMVTRGHLVALRPGTGLSPSILGDIEGRTIARSVTAGGIVVADDLLPPL